MSPEKPTPQYKIERRKFKNLAEHYQQDIIKFFNLYFGEISDYLSNVIFRVKDAPKDEVNVGSSRIKLKNSKPVVEIFLNRIMEADQQATDIELTIISTIAHEYAHIFQLYLGEFKKGIDYEHDILYNFGIDPFDDNESYHWQAKSEDQAFYFEGIFLKWLIDSQKTKLDREFILHKMETLKDMSIELFKFNRTRGGHPDNSHMVSLFLAGFNSSDYNQELRLLFGLASTQLPTQRSS